MPDAAVARLPQTLTGGLEIVAARVLGDVDDARDTVQETLARALEALRDNRVPAALPLEAFVYGIARHVIADVQRRRARDRGAIRDVSALPAPDPSPLDALVRAEERERVTRALATLLAADRELLERCFVQGERVAAIAASLGEPANRIRIAVTVSTLLRFLAGAVRVCQRMPRLLRGGCHEKTRTGGGCIGCPGSVSRAAP